VNPCARQADLEIARTNRISVAKLHLGDFHKEERQRAAAQTAVAWGKMTFAGVLQTYRERLKGDHSLKDRSKSSRRTHLQLDFVPNQAAFNAAFPKEK
jgi:hypothetical protein